MMHHELAKKNSEYNSQQFAAYTASDLASVSCGH